MRTLATSLTVAALGIGCSVELPDVPFACADGATCPEGYSCVAQACVLDGATPVTTRIARAGFVNSAELTFVASPKGGATLLYNDGFAEGSRGLYEARVGLDGRVEGPHLVFDFGEEFATASSVVELDDQNYGVLVLRFPNIDQKTQSVGFYRVPRERFGESVTPELIAQPAKMPGFAGGVEPTYVSAVKRGGNVDVAYSDPTAGGSVVVGRVVGSVIEERVRVPLGEVEPLSADSLLWDLGDALALRVGFENNEVWRVPEGAAPLLAGPLQVQGTPIFAQASGVVSVTFDDTSRQATYRVTDWTGIETSAVALGFGQEDLEPYSAVATPRGVLLAPTSDSEAFESLRALRFGIDGLPTQGAALSRPGDDAIYSGRAFANGGKMFIAWLAFHEDFMDVWVGVTEDSG